jgi:hypothetical protein
MSNGRRLNRAARRRKTEQLLQDAARQPARYVGRSGDHEVWRRGAVVFVLPATPNDAPVAVKNGLAARRVAALRGRCDCGAGGGRPWMDATGVEHMTFQHEHDCPASDENLRVAWRGAR